VLRIGKQTPFLFGTFYNIMVERVWSCNICWVFYVGKSSIIVWSTIIRISAL